MIYMFALQTVKLQNNSHYPISTLIHYFFVFQITVRESTLNRSNLLVNMSDRQELDLAIDSIHTSYIKAKKDLQKETHEIRQDLLYGEIEVLGNILVRLEKVKDEDLPAGG